MTDNIRPISGNRDEGNLRVLDLVRKRVDQGDVIRLAVVALIDCGEGMAATELWQSHCDRDQWIGLLTRGAYNVMSGEDVDEGDVEGMSLWDCLGGILGGAARDLFGGPPKPEPKPDPYWDPWHIPEIARNGLADAYWHAWFQPSSTGDPLPGTKRYDVTKDPKYDLPEPPEWVRMAEFYGVKE